MKDENVGKRISKVLKDNGFSQRTFADKIGLSQSVVSDMIRGRRQIDKLVNIVAERFGVSRDYLITGNESNKMDLIASDSISANGLTKDEKLQLINNLEELYRKHQKILDEASQVMKEIAAINKLLIIGTN